MATGLTSDGGGQFNEGLWVNDGGVTLGLVGQALTIDVNTSASHINSAATTVTKAITTVAANEWITVCTVSTFDTGTMSTLVVTDGSLLTWIPGPTVGNANQPVSCSAAFSAGILTSDTITVTSNATGNNSMLAGIMSWENGYPAILNSGGSFANSGTQNVAAVTPNVVPGAYIVGAFLNGGGAGTLTGKTNTTIDTTLSDATDGDGLAVGHLTAANATPNASITWGTTTAGTTFVGVAVLEVRPFAPAIQDSNGTKLNVWNGTDNVSDWFEVSSGENVRAGLSVDGGLVADSITTVLYGNGAVGGGGNVTVGNALTVANSATITAGGLTVSSGTSAFQAVTDTTTKMGANGTLINSSIACTTTSPGAVGAAACVDTSITCANTTTGAACMVGAPTTATLALTYNCYVSAAGTVKLHICNPTAGSLTPGTGTYTVRTFQ